MVHQPSTAGTRRGSTALRPRATTTTAASACVLLLVATSSLVVHAFVPPSHPASSSFSSSTCPMSTSSFSPSSLAPSPSTSSSAASSSVRIPASIHSFPFSSCPRASIPVLGSMAMDGGGGGGGMGGMTVVNQVMLIGNLGSEPAVKYLDSGNCVLSVSLAVNKEMPPLATRGGEGGASEVDWIRVEAWGRTAEYLAAGARKGSKVWVLGKLITNSWVDKYGQNRNDLKVRVKRAEVLQTAKTQMPPQMGGGGYYQQQGGWEGEGDMGQQQEPMMMVDDYLGGGGGMGGGQQQLPHQPQQSYGGNKVPAAVPPVTAPYRKKATYGNDGGGGGVGGRGSQYEVESYDVDTDIPF